MSDVPLDIYIAGYSDPESAKADFDALKKAQRKGIVFIDGAVLVSRDADGTLHVKESGDHDVFKGATIGVAGGLVLGLFAPPLLGAMVVGGVIGGLVGKLVKHHDEKGIAKDVDEVVPPGTSGVIAVFEEIWVEEVERELAKAEKKAVKQADKQTAKELQKALAGPPRRKRADADRVRLLSRGRPGSLIFRGGSNGTAIPACRHAGMASRAPRKKHTAPTRVPRSASVRSTAAPVLGITNAPIADAMKATDPIMLSHATHHAASRGRHVRIRPSARIANVLEMRNRIDP